MSVMCMYHVCTDAWREQKRAADRMELELEIVVRHCKSSLKSSIALKCWAISLAPIYINIFFIYCVWRERECVCQGTYVGVREQLVGILSFQCMGSKDGPQVIRLSSSHVYPLSHLVCHIYYIYTHISIYCVCS